MTPLKVCFVAGGIYPVLAARPDLPTAGGAEVQQFAIARELRERGVEVVFVGEDRGQGRDTWPSGFRPRGPG